MATPAASRAQAGAACLARCLARCVAAGFVAPRIVAGISKIWPTASYASIALPADHGDDVAYIGNFTAADVLSAALLPLRSTAAGRTIHSGLPCAFLRSPLTRQLEDVQKLSYSHGCSAFLCVPIPGASHGRASGGAFLLGFCSDLAPEMASMQAAATLLAQALAPLLPSLLPLLPRPPARSASSRRHCAAVPSEASLDSRFSAGSGDHSDECSGSSGGDADGRGGAQADSDMDCESCSGRRLTPCDSKLAGRPWRAASAMLPVSLLASALAELQQVVGPQRADDRPPQLDGPSLVPEHPEGAPAAAATTPEALTLNAQLFTDMQRW